MPPQVTLDPEREALARVVHDLRSPLTVIRGLLFVLQREDAEPRRRQRLELIDGEVDRLARGLDRLLTPARTTPSVTCLAAATTAAVVRHRPVAAIQEISLTVRAGRGAVPVAADSDDLGRILDNLVVNALRHSPRGGEVRLSLRQRGDTASVTVRDQGPGVPPGDREAIFRPGERGTAPRGPGQGLGLAISRELAQRHRGRLELVPLGPGAAFRLVLPRAAAAHDVPRTAA